MRKAVVEPVFGQIKECRGFRRFLFRGLKKVEAEWQIICLTHNLLKLFRAGVSPQEAQKRPKVDLLHGPGYFASQSRPQPVL